MHSGKFAGEEIANNDREEQGQVALGDVRSGLELLGTEELTMPPQPRSKFSRERAGTSCLRQEMCEMGRGKARF